MPSSPKDGTPISVPSPLSLAPAPPTKSNSHSVLGAPLSSPLNLPNLPHVTSKDWILPPRPKPGRKPATDTPPTKRKAQNRAAQRAFRERRASKVGELEEHIRQIEEEDEREQTELRERVERLEADVEHYKAKLEAWADRAEHLKQDVNIERTKNEQFRAELERLKWESRQLSKEAPDAAPLQSRKPQRQEDFAGPRQTSDQDAVVISQGNDGDVSGCARCTLDTRCECKEQALKVETMGCGKCSPDTRCQCIEEALKIPDIAYPTEMPAPGTKRPHSPPQVVTNKRHHDNTAVIEAEELETDFTTRYASNKTENHFGVGGSPETASPAMDRDPCGFCSDGSHCVCAELEHEATYIDQQSRLPSVLSHITPPPSDSDVQCRNSKDEFLYPSRRRSVPASNPCANGPGTCAQCQKDPQSTLFCKSVAAMRGPTSNSIGACCGDPGATGGCCRSQAPDRASNTHPLNRPLLSCADAYTTLSRHPRYSEASEEFGTWLPRLNATSPPAGVAPFEMDAAEVMSVLKLFDRRFGKD